jgi:hypothetical protein
MSDQPKTDVFEEVTKYYLSAGTSPIDAWQNILSRNAEITISPLVEKTIVVLSEQDAKYLMAHGAISKKEKA